MSFAQNLNRLMAEANIDQSELSRRLGVTSQAVNQWCNGDTRPRGQRLEAIAAALGTTVADLVSNRTDEYSNIPIHSVPTPRERGFSYEGSNFVLIPEVAVKPQAGHGAMQPDMNAKGQHITLAEWRIPADFLGKNLPSIDNLVIVEVNGDSMMPDYAHGDRVLVDMSHKKPSPPGIYVLWDGLGLVLKCVELLIGRPHPTLRLKSLNPDYADYECLLADTQISGRVVGKWVWK